MSESKQKVEAFQSDLAALRQEIGRYIVGQDDLIRDVLICILGRGHALLEGVPGLGKTVLVKTIASAVDADFSRVQFTPDLMPADIVGTNMIVEDEKGKRYEFQRGPVFANIVLADEINRATPKTQSALLEAMSEASVTVGNTTYPLKPPFFVLATQNPLEMEGTYPLPEAQLDRFFYKLTVPFPNREALHQILERTTSAEKPTINKVISRQRLTEMSDFVRQVPIAKSVQDFAIRVLLATHPDGPGATEATKKYVRFGGSPRGAQTLILAGKINALLEGRFAVATDDIRTAAKPALRHRLGLNFEGQAEGITADQVIEQILDKTPEAV